MFRPNNRHLQMPIISSIAQLPEAYRERLDTSWAGTFYREFFIRIDEDSLRFCSRTRHPGPIRPSIGWKEAHTDGGYNGQAADAAAAAHDVMHIQSAIRGAQPAGERVALAEFAIAPADRGTPDTLTCLQG